MRSADQAHFHIPYILLFNAMSAIPFQNALLAPYLTLPQGGKIQAECRCLRNAYLISVLTPT